MRAQGIPIESARSIDDYIRFSQTAQAIALQSWMEHYRRRKWLCGGSLYWNLFDNWPQIADAAVDYYFQPKMSYYSIKRAYADFLISFQPEGNDTLEVVAVNDLPESVDGELVVILEDWRGRKIWEDRTNAAVSADSAKVLRVVRLADLPAHDPCGSYLKAVFISSGKACGGNLHFFCEPAMIDPPPCALTAKVVSKLRLGTVEVEVTTDAFATYVHLSADGVDEVYFSDNWFHLPAGETRVVTVSSSGNGTPELNVAALNSQCVRVLPW